MRKLTLKLLLDLPIAAPMETVLLRSFFHCCRGLSLEELNRATLTGHAHSYAPDSDTTSEKEGGKVKKEKEKRGEEKRREKLATMLIIRT